MNYTTPWRWSTKTETCRKFLKIGFNQSDFFLKFLGVKNLKHSEKVQIVGYITQMQWDVLFVTLFDASSYLITFLHFFPLSLFSNRIIYPEPRLFSRCSECTTGRTTKEQWFNSRQTHEYFSLPKVQPLLEMHPPIQWAPWAPPPVGEQTKVYSTPLNSI